jgi:2-aminoadipate transaminase
MEFANRISNIKPSAIREVGKKIAAKENCISFAAGLPSPDFFPSDEIREITDYILKEKSDIALQYGPTKGHQPLMEKIAKMLGESGIKCTEKNIQITTGSQQAISFCCMAFVNPGDVVITEKPSYLGALASFRAYECEFAGVDVDDSGMIPESLEKIIKANPNSKMIYVVPNFSNPTGRTWSRERRKEIYEIAKKHDLPIIEDNPYGDIRFDGEKIESIKTYDNSGQVVYLGSFSKIFCPGLRVGFICSSEELSEKFEMLKQGADLQSNQLAQMQIDEYLNRYDLNTHIDKIKEGYRKKRDLMIREIVSHVPKEVKYTNPSGGMFIWFELPTDMDGYGLLEKTLERNVGFVPGGPFFPEDEMKNTIRLNFSTMSDNNISEGIKILGEVITEELNK